MPVGIAVATVVVVVVVVADATGSVVEFQSHLYFGLSALLSQVEEKEKLVLKGKVVVARDGAGQTTSQGDGKELD